MILGPSDYGVVRGLHPNFTSSCAPGSPGDPSGDLGVGALGIRGLMNPGGGLTWGKTTLTGISDGTSNTILASEVGGRQQIIARGVPVGAKLNSCWADYNIHIRVRGFSTGMAASLSVSSVTSDDSG